MVDEKDNDIRRKTLEAKYKSVKKKTKNYLSWGAGFMKDMNEIADAADLGVEAAKHGSPFGDWELAISSAERLDDDLNRLTPITISYDNIHISLFSSSTSVVSSGGSLVTGSSSMFNSDVERENAAKVSAAYGLYFEKYKLKDEVLKLMMEFGFELSKQGRNAIEKFRCGWEMYYTNPPDVDTSSGSVIPVRQSIKLTIDELLILRPVQQKAKRKITEIGLQLKADSIGIDVFEEMDQEYNKLVNELSGTKDEFFSRERRYEMMRKGTLFLRRLFTSLDQQKLKKRHRVC